MVIRKAVKHLFVRPILVHLYTLFQYLDPVQDARQSILGQHDSSTDFANLVEQNQDPSRKVRPCSA